MLMKIIKVESIRKYCMSECKRYKSRFHITFKMIDLTER